MENPATWNPLEHVIHDALKQAEANRKAGVIGLSQTRIIADKLREAHLVIEQE